MPLMAANENWTAMGYSSRARPAGEVEEAGARHPETDSPPVSEMVQ